MSKEIKFRAIDLKRNKFVYGDLIQCKTRTPNQTYICVSTDFEEDRPYDSYKRECEFIEVDVKTVGQFIGYKDIQGVEIYEDDILQVEFTGDEIEIDLEVVKDIRNIPKLFGSSRESVVIGNIHQNKELLE